MGSEIKIVVLQRGWIVVGRYRCENSQVTVEGASVIRRWGTTKGLGELASGPLKATILDHAGTVRAHELAVVMTLDVDSEKWMEHCK